MALDKELMRLRNSHSRLGTASSCMRKFELSTFYDNPPSRVYEEDTTAAEAGKAMHEAFQTYLLTGSKEHALWQLGIHYPHTQAWSADHKRSLEACAATLEAAMQPSVMEGKQLVQIECLDGKVRPAIEVPFEIIFDGIELPGGYTVSHIGYIDAIMQDKRTGICDSLDIKTHQRYGDRIGEYKFNGQQLPYGIVVQHLQGADFRQFRVRYLDMFIDVADPQVQEFAFVKTQEHVTEWFVDSVMMIRQMHGYMKLGHWPKTRHGCMAFNKPCRFLNICDTTDPVLLQRVLLQGAEPDKREPFEPWVRIHVTVPDEWKPT